MKSESSHKPRGMASRLRPCLAVAAALVSAVPAGAVVCPSGGDSALPAPAVESLRGYRAAFRSPTRLAVDGLGRIYVADPVRGRVVVRDADGRLLSSGEGLGRPVAVAVDAAGERIWVGDGNDGRVTAYAADWLPLFDLGQGPGEFALPGDLAVDPETGSVWVTDSFAHEVKVYGPTGAFRFSFGGRGKEAGEFQYPMGIHVDAGAGEVLVVDQVNARVQVFDRQGDFKSCLGVREDAGDAVFTMPQGIWTDGLGRIYVTDAFQSWVRVVDRQGAEVATIGDVGRGPGELTTPSDLVVDPSGRLVVSSTGAGRLEMFGLDGYTDPERFVPAAVAIDDTSAEPTVTAVVEVPGYRLELVEPESVSANGVAALAGSAVIGDADGDHEADLAVGFDRAELAATLAPSGSGTVEVTGRIGDLELVGSAHVNLAPAGTDEDGDGVANDADRCPGTPAGSAVDDEGCGLAQLCPCAGPEPGRSWKNHGQYVSCVSRRVRDITHPPLDRRTRQRLVREAARSDCGKEDLP